MVKPFHLIFVLLVTLSGCGLLRPAPGPAQSSAKGGYPSPFLEDIVVTTGGGPSQVPAREEQLPPLEDDYRPSLSINTGLNITEAIPEQFRFAILLNTEVEYLSNKELYQLIRSWWGAPYRMGGMTQRGVDCSAFVQTIMAGAFEVALPRTARLQKDACQPVERSALREGDLVFFNTRGGVSHVGIYLHNNKFVHASTSGGVTISDLDETYWDKRFIGGGRFAN